MLFWCLWVGGIARAADTTTLAVLPLTKAAGSETYDGLGSALAGMLVSDLSTVPAVQLVERDRLDTVLSEIALGDTAFVDPKTAQRLGKGVGAEAVMTGSYSVVGEVFLLDARIVETRSARILKAVAAQGTVTDFVAVEKDLMEQLLDGLDVELDSASRRRLLVGTPTEAWEAFTEYGKGLDAQADGRLDDAASSFEAALRKDPKFELARAALSDLRALLESEKARSRARADTVHAAAEDAVLAAWGPGVGKTAPGATDPAPHMEAMIGFALRLMVLEDQERWCERYGEMLDHLEHVDWAVVEPPKTPGGVWSYQLGKKAESVGYAAMSKEVPAPPMSYESPAARISMFRDTWRYVLGGTNNLHRGDFGLLGAMRECLPISERPAEIERLRALAAKNGASAILEDPSRSRGFTIDEGLSIAWAAATAAHEGATPDLQARTQALIDGRAEADPARAAIRKELEQVATAAEDWQTHRWRRFAQPDEVLVRTMKGLAVADPAVVRTEGGISCAHLVAQEKNRGRDWVEAWEKNGPEHTWAPGELDAAGWRWGMLRDAGCLVGTEGRFEDHATLFAFLASVESRKRPGADAISMCRMGFSTLGGMTKPEAMATSLSTPQLTDWAVYSQLIVYHAQVVWERCVEVP